MKIVIERERCHFFLPAIILLLAGSAFAGFCPETDLNGDCMVDLADLKVFSSQWLNTIECENEFCADFDGFNGVGFNDFSFLADEWHTGLPLVINEFMASNSSDSGIHDPAGDYDDWIEIYNYGNTPIDLAGMYLTDDLANPTKWRIPSGYSAQTTVPAGGFVIIWADEEPGEDPLHADFKLSADGEEIGLATTDGETWIDALSFAEQTSGISYGRYPDMTNNLRFFSIPTPSAVNNGTYLDEIDEVVFSHPRGFYSSSFNLTMACVTPGAAIYYTTDGRNPVIGEVNTPTSKRYTAQINVSSTKSIRAAAIKTGWRPSKTTTNTYIFGASSAIKAMPLVALAGDPNNTFFEPNGIMAIVGGYYNSGVWQSGGAGTYNNPIHRGIAYERPASFEIVDPFTADGNYQEDCGIRVHGSDYTRPRYTRGDDWSCSSNKFGFNLFFRNDYGDNQFDYPFFPFTPEVKHPQSIALRAGHNDNCSPFVKDEWARRLFKEMGGVQLTGTFANLYINGVYKSYYNPCGRDDEEFFQEWYGSDNDFDVITQSGIRDGDNVAFNSLLDFIGSHNLFNSADYNYFAARFDIPMFIDYLILQIYSANFDWPNNNYTVHRERSDTGKFRFTVWDAEGIGSGAGIGVNAFEDMPTYGIAPKGLNGLEWDYIPRFYRALRASPEFKQLFADHAHKHFRNGGVLTKDHLLAKWWEVLAEVSAVLPYQDTDIPNTFIPAREPYVLAAFQTNGLFNLALSAPVFNVNGGYKFGGYVSTSDTFTLTDPCSTGGTIYYTTDGSDPRLPAIGDAGPKIVQYVLDSAAKKVLVPGSDIGTSWRGGSEPYNDSTWTSGYGGVGYALDSAYDQYIGINVESAMYNINSTCYIRIPFTVDACDVGRVTSLTLRMRHDDGFVAYLNGTEANHMYSPATPVWNSLATFGVEIPSGAFTSYNISNYAGALHAGTNILAIHGLNTPVGGTTADFLISALLEAIVIIPPVEPNISPIAIPYTSSFTINKSTNLRARVLKSNGEWSALNEAVYTLANVGQNLRITEIMYNPADTGEPNDEDTEYIELKNKGSSTINLNLVKFDKGIDFTFGPNTLTAGQHTLVVKDINAFTTKYGAGRYIAGQYTGSLNNAGERIRLLDAVGTTILDFNYSDGWRDITDGDGYSLTITNPADSNLNHWGNKDYWRSSAYIDGSPGWDDSGIIPNPNAIVINEVLAHSHATASDWIELRNTTGSSINIGGWYLSDSDSNLMKYRFAPGTTIPANGYKVIYEANNFGPNSIDPNKLVGFALSEIGEMVCLTSLLDSNGFLTGYREKEEFGASETGISFGRYYKASTNSFNFVPMSTITTGSVNSYPKLGPIVITEIMYHPDWPATGSYANDEYEYIELRNTSGSSVTLYDSNENEPWAFTDGIDYIFPDSPPVTIANGARIIVAKNPTAFQARYPTVPVGIIKGPYTGWLANDGEQLELGKPGDVNEMDIRQYIRVERVNYSDGSHPGDASTDPWPINADGRGKSLTRTSTTLYGNDPNNWTAATPTPGS